MAVLHFFLVISPLIYSILFAYSPFNFQVSWIRLRDWHILTTDQSTFTNDERFHVIHQPQTSDWTLAIKFITKRDEGVYVCQVEYS